MQRSVVMPAINYQVERCLRQDWCKGMRYYSCELRQNLFGQWVLLRRWGRALRKEDGRQPLVRRYAIEYEDTD